jgi:hypothetical protein
MGRMLRGLMLGKVAVFVVLCLSVLAQGANGAINFETTTISGFNGPYHIITADFNNDTKPDLAVTNWPGNQLTILLGDGLGNYSVASTLATGVHPNFIAAGDFDNNGSLDLAITNGSGLREVTLFFNDGTGTSWTSDTLLTEGDADLVSVVAANFTSSTDSNIDLFILKDSGYVADFYEVWQGNGSGAFTEIASANTGDLPLFAAAGDFNGDTNLDIAVANYFGNSLTILLGNGDGTFSEAGGSPITVGTNPRGIATGHLNGDAHIDLAVVNPGNNTVSILLGNGDGTFAAAANVTSGGVPGSLVISDFDGDGKNDIAVTRSNANVISIYRGNGDGTFDPTSIDVSVGTLPSFIAAGDLDKDGKPDLTVTNYNSNDVTILLNRSGECVQAPSGLVAWWGGDNNTLDIVGAHNGTFQGSAAFVPGKVGRAFSFDGAEANFVEIPNSAELNPSGAFSVDGWFYIDPAASGNAGEIATLVAKTEGSTGDGWALYFDDRWSTKSLKFVLGTVLELQNAIPTANWYHIAGVFDPSTTPNSKLYLNGGMVASVNSGGAGANGLNVRIGAMYWTDFYHQGNDRLNGMADEVELFNRALSAEEIAAIYNAGSWGKCRPCFIPPAGMVSWWTADGDADDVIGTNHGTLQNGTTYAAGMVGQAFSFDGVDDYVEVPHAASLDLTGGMTLEAWVELRAPGYSIIFSKADYNGSESVTSYGLQITPDGGINVGLYGTYPADNWTTAGGLVAVDQWYHVALTWDGTYGPSDNVKLFLNGAPLQTWTKSLAPLNVTTQTLTLGSMKPPTYYGHMNGLIDEPGIFSRALTAEEIAALYAAGSAGMCTPEDTTPDPFPFAEKTDVELSAIVPSDPISVTGIDAAAPISISGGEYEINGSDTWTIGAGTVNNNDTVRVRQTSSGNFSTRTDTTLTIGGVSETFSITTIPIPTYTITGSVPGGNGTIVCTSPVNQGDSSTCTISPDADYHLATLTDNGMSVIGSVSNGQYTISNVTADHEVIGTFSIDTFPLSLALQGTGSGTVTSNPAGVNCGSTCDALFDSGTLVILTATPATGSFFAGWSGDCNADGEVTMNATKSCTATFTAYTALQVQAPNGGEDLMAGQSYTIRWGAPAAMEKFDILYSLDGGLTWKKQATKTAGNSTLWTLPVPAGSGNKKKCLVRVIGYNGQGAKAGTDTSDRTFAINVVRLDSLNGGQPLDAGTTVPVTWTRRGGLAATTTKVYYSLNGGVTWAYSGQANADAGQYDWEVPLTKKPMTTCRVKVTLFNGATVVGSDKSDGNFTIRTVEVVDPNGGETLPAGQPYDISYTVYTRYPYARADVYLSLDGGATWKIAGQQPSVAAPSVATLSINVPAVTATKKNCKLKVQLVDEEARMVTNDASNAVFTISPR